MKGLQIKKKTAAHCVASIEEPSVLTRRFLESV